MTTSKHLSHIKIVLDGNKPHYQSGEAVTGSLEVSSKDQLKPSDIEIHLVCTAETKWTETNGVHKGTYNEEKKFLELIYEMQNSDNWIEDGFNQVPFAFKLPESGIPSSFESTYGSIAYFIEGFIGRESKLKTKIHVNSPVRENLKVSVGASIEKDICCLNFGSGKIILHATLSKKGHIPGEVLEVHCGIENDSTVPVHPKVSLFQTQIYMCGDRHKGLEIPLTEQIVGSKVDSEEKNTETLLVPIPENTPLSMKSSIITVRYFIHVSLTLPHGIDMFLNLPLIITSES